jgi:hypothetical protein
MTPKPSIELRVNVAVVVEPGATLSEAGFDEMDTTGFRSAVNAMEEPVTPV